MSSWPGPISITDLEQWPSPDHARWGLGTHLFQIPTGNMQRILGQYARKANGLPPMHLMEHPNYTWSIRQWEKWRLVYEAGDVFIQEFVKKFSNREDPRDFARRKEITPIAAFATAAINEIKNSIFQRIGDTTRSGGPDSYQRCIKGLDGGVDMHSSTINWFIGHYILPELLVQKKIGVYVDAPKYGNTQADKGMKHPFFIPYRAEDIRNWSFTSDGEGNDFSAILLREYVYVYDDRTGLPVREVPRFRHVFLKEGRVYAQFFDQFGVTLGPITQLDLKKIPFAVGELTESLMKNVANHQIALVNMESSDISYMLKSNFPFYTEQYDSKNQNPLIRSAQSTWQEYYNAQCPPGAASVQGVTGAGQPCPPATGENIDAGPSAGRRYPIGADRPQFIAPPTDPIKVSMEKERNLKDDIRSLVHLALASVQSKTASAESKLVDREQGLESGLAAIGLELEHLERKLGCFWNAYEGKTEPTIIYPSYWSIKNIGEIAKELETWESLRDSVPSLTFKKEVNKVIAEQVLGSRVSPDVMQKIRKEIEAAKGGSSDPKTITSDVEAGIVSADTASSLRGYPDGEVEAAQEERAERLAAIAEAQASGKAVHTVAGKQAVDEVSSELNNPAARGVPELSADPAGDAAAEKIGKQGRGEAQ